MGALLGELTAACPEMTDLARLVRFFAAVPRPDPANEARLRAWAETARSCDLPNVHAFTRGLHLDTHAVIAALTLPFHNGPTEGVNTKTKMIKRQMYGRAGTLLSTHPVTVKDVTRRGASGRTCYGGQSAFTDMTCQAHRMAATAPAQIRPFQPGDHSQVLALAPRLTEGVAPWRDPAAVRRAAQNWVQTSIDTACQPDHAVYVAIAMDRVVGVVTIREQTHFTGQTDAYVGELAVASGMERRGIATALMNAAEAWAAQRDLAFLTLQTGAANQRARGLYRRLGYHEEELLLTKAISGRHKPF